MIASLVIDLDNVLADSMRKFCELASKKTGETYTLHDIKNHKVVGSVHLSYSEISEVQRTVWDNWKTIPPCEIDSATSVSEIREDGIKVIVCTSRPGYDYGNQELWLKNFGIIYDEFRVVSPHSHKSAIEADALIDDAPEEVADWMRQGRRGFIYTRPWNEVEEINNAIRILRLKDAMKNIAKWNRME